MPGRDGDANTGMQIRATTDPSLYSQAETGSSPAPAHLRQTSTTSIPRPKQPRLPRNPPPRGHPLHPAAPQPALRLLTLTAANHPPPSQKAVIVHPAERSPPPNGRGPAAPPKLDPRPGGKCHHLLRPPPENPFSSSENPKPALYPIPGPSPALASLGTCRCSRHRGPARPPSTRPAPRLPPTPTTSPTATPLPPGRNTPASFRADRVL